MIKHLLKLVWARKRSNILLVLEVFFSFLVVFAVACMVVYYADSARRPLGFEYRDVWDVAIDVRDVRSEAEVTATIDRLLAGAKEMREVREAALMSVPPYSLSEFTDAVLAGARRAETNANIVTEEFDRVMGLELVSGRWFTREDEGASVAPVVINRRLAEALFGEKDAVGQEIQSIISDDRERVIGVVEDYREKGEYSGVYGYVFRRRSPFDTTYAPRNIVLKVQSGTNRVAFEEQLMRRLQAEAPDWSFDIKTLGEKREMFNRYKLLAVGVAGIVALFMMLMVAFGLLGVLWQTVTRRTAEYGLRRAVGATATRVKAQVIFELVLMISMAVLIASFFLAQIPIFGIMDWLGVGVLAAAYVVALILVYGMGTLAALYPGWLATRIQPAEALHYE